MRIDFYAGEPLYPNEYGANYLRGEQDDVILFAQCPVPEECSDFYGYMALKKAIIAQAAENGIAESDLDFFVDETDLPDDAYIEVEVRDYC